MLMLRFPAFCWTKYVDSPFTRGLANRVRSPAGGSTLMTSAPRSVSIRVACGPASTRVKSSTRIPASGPATLRRYDAATAFLHLDCAPERANEMQEPGGRSGDDRDAGDLVDDETGPGHLRRATPAALVRHHDAFKDQFAAPDAVRLAPLERPGEAQRANRARRADRPGPGELHRVLGEEQVGQRGPWVGAASAGVDLGVHGVTRRDPRQADGARRRAVD